MRGKKILSVLLSAAMLGSTSGLSAFAESTDEAPAKKTFNYVALGDSVAAGYELEPEGGLLNDRGLVITDELLADPVKAAYPQVLTNYLTELGKQYGVEVKGTNLSATAFRAEDVELTIKDPKYRNQIAQSILEYFYHADTDAIYSPYYDYFNDYLKEADLVSIQLGGNDIAMNLLFDMLKSKNPIIQGIGCTGAFIAFGFTPSAAVTIGIGVMTAAKDNITADSFLEATNYMQSFSDKIDGLTERSYENVKSVINTVKEINGNADIAVVSMYNPFANDYDEQKLSDKFNEVLEPIFAQAAEIAAQNEGQADNDGEPTDEFIDTLSEKAERVTEMNKALDALGSAELADEILEQTENAKSIDELMDNIDEITTGDEYDSISEPLKKFFSKFGSIEELKAFISMLRSGGNIGELIDIPEIINNIKNNEDVKKAIVDEILTPIALTIAADKIDPKVKALNEKLKTAAEETGAVYVDVYNITPDNDFDPHPKAQGHKDIADIMFRELSDLIAERMGGDDITTDDDDQTSGDQDVSDSRAVGDVNGDGKVNVTDIVLTASHVKSIKALNEENIKYADANHNGRIEVTDIVLIAAHVKGIKPLK